jgi:hypothetical protein
LLAIVAAICVCVCVCVCVCLTIISMFIMRLRVRGVKRQNYDLMRRNKELRVVEVKQRGVVRVSEGDEEDR